MAIGQFPKNMYLRLLADSVEMLGSLMSDVDMELVYVVLTVLTRGTPAGSERFRLKILPANNIGATPLATSEWRNLSELGQNKYGRLRFDFAQEPINHSIRYYVAIESSSYTKTGSFYVAAKLDWPDAVNDPETVSTRGAQMAFIGYR